MKKLMICTLFFLMNFTHAQTLTIHGKVVKTSRLSGDPRVNLIGAVIAENLSVDLGENSLKDIPAGSSVYFQKNFGEQSNLKVSGMVINRPMANQQWTFKNGKSLTLNCGRYASGPAFIELSKDFDLLSGCRSAVDQSWNSFIIKDKSSLAFFQNGKLKGSSLTAGTLNLNGQSVSLEEDKGVRYHDNGQLFYFHPAAGAEFTASTELNDDTVFYQPETMDSFAVMFHENGQLSTAILKEPEAEVTVTLFGTEVPFFIASGPVGFNESGIVDRLSLKNRLTVVVAEATFIKSTETYFQAVSYGRVTPGMEISIAAGEQLFLESSAERKNLRAFTEQGQQGLTFFNEVSSKPFISK